MRLTTVELWSVRFGAQAIYRERDADSATYGFFNNGANATSQRIPERFSVRQHLRLWRRAGTVSCETTTLAVASGQPDRWLLVPGAHTGL
jgi:hypothetical protein